MAPHRVSCHRDSWNKSRTAAPAWKAGRGSRLGICDGGATLSARMPRVGIMLRIPDQDT